MSKLSNSLREIETIDEIARRDQWMNRLHPLVKLCVTVFYMIMVVSFDRYDLMGLLGMLIYPLISFELGEISVKDALYKLRMILPLVCLVGLFNPFFDKIPCGTFLGIRITTGMLSMLTLILKGIFTVLSSYLLIATTTIEGICSALRILHVPKLMVTQVLLVYRYLFVLMSEVDRITQAYSLRAPGQKGIHFKVWGCLVGQLLLRSMDRADELYQCMCLRGYQGEFYHENHHKLSFSDVGYLMIWIAILLIFRIFPVFEIIGGLII